MFRTASHLIGISQTGNISNQINLHPFEYNTAVALNSARIPRIWQRLDELVVGDVIGMVVIPPDHVINHVRLATEPYKGYTHGQIKDPLYAGVVNLGISNVVTFDLVEQLFTGIFDHVTQSWTYSCAPNAERTLVSNVDLKGDNGINGVNRWNVNPATSSAPYDTSYKNWVVYGLKIKTLPAAPAKLTDLSTYIDLCVNIIAHDTPQRST
jgi:hypothetical protein